MKIGFLMIPACFLAATFAVAQDAPSGALSLKTVVQKMVQVVEETGETRTELVPAEVAVPGDEIVYTTTFTNVGDEPADNVLITNPIPAEMRYAAGSAFGPGADIEYSADGGVNYSDAASLLVSDAGGQQRVASVDDYTHIRWQLTEPLAPGAQGIARFRAVVR